MKEKAVQMIIKFPIWECHSNAATNQGGLVEELAGKYG